MTDKLEASRLTPETLRALAQEPYFPPGGYWWDTLSQHSDAWAADIADSCKEIERLREQLRAYRGAERIAHDKLEAAE